MCAHSTNAADDRAPGTCNTPIRARRESGIGIHGRRALCDHRHVIEQQNDSPSTGITFRRAENGDEAAVRAIDGSFTTNTIFEVSGDEVLGLNAFVCAYVNPLITLPDLAARP